MKSKQKNQYSKCLITGANGFIGGHLVKKLSSLGCDITTIPHEWMTLQPHLLERLPQDFDWIFHLASFGNMSNQTEEAEILNANVFGTYNLLQATKSIPYKAFINVSSSSVSLPHETMYSATKASAERLCKAMADEYDKPIISVRPFSVYGPGEASFRFIPTVFRSCLTGESMKLVPDPRHDWIYIDDIVNRMISAAECIDSLHGQSIELGTGKSTSNMKIVELVENITVRQANIEIVKTMRSFDNTKWVSRIDVENFTPLHAGLKKYYESITK